MTEKRFTVRYENDEGICFWEIIDNKTQNNTSNEKKLCEWLNELAEENEQSKMMIATLRNIILEQEDLGQENKELKERNNRQAKQLDDLYRLIEQKDWRALSDIMDDFKKAEEQLQSEWQTYCDDGND